MESVKQLRQLLLQKQEPFSLKAYLNEKEKAYYRDERCSYILRKKSTRRIQYCSKIIKALSRKFNFNSSETKNSNSATVKERKIQEFERFSSASIELDGKLSLKDSSSKQLSPVSVLEETQYDQEKPSFNQIREQRKQLLYDCIREVVIKQQHLVEFMGPEKLAKIISRYWSGNESSITQILRFDYGDSVQEWSDFEPHTKEIAMEICDAILEDIKNEIVANMLDIM